MKEENIRWGFLEMLENGLAFFWVLDDEILLIPCPKIFTNERNQLHCPDGPAVEWPREKYFFWNNINIPEEYITKTCSAKDILNNRNAEQRRAGFESFGWKKIIEDLGALIIQQDDYGTLYEIPGSLNDGDAVAKFVRCICPSTNREYFLRVPPGTKTAREGLASLAQVSEKEYTFTRET